MCYLLTSNKEIINVNGLTRIYINGRHINHDGIEGYSIEGCVDADRNDKCKRITLEKFALDEKYVADDVFCQLSILIDGAPDNKVINLAELSKQIKYEYQTGRQYKDEGGELS